ncbi:MAG: hypothetical protein AAGE94_04455, partial [Acidobacteriota bacterium]
MERGQRLDKYLDGLLAPQRVEETDWLSIWVPPTGKDFVEALDELAPTDDELADRQPALAALFAGRSQSTALRYATNAFDRLDRAGRLDRSLFFEAVARCFEVRSKTEPLRILRFIARLAADGEPGDAEPAVTAALAHTQTDVQQRAVEVLEGFGEPVRRDAAIAAFEQARPVLRPDLIERVAAWLGLDAEPPVETAADSAADASIGFSSDRFADVPGVVPRTPKRSFEQWANARKPASVDALVDAFEPLDDPERPWADAAYEPVARLLAGRAAAVRSVAADALIEAIDDGRADPVPIGRALGAFFTEKDHGTERASMSLGDVARASDHHATFTCRLLDAMIGVWGDQAIGGVPFGGVPKLLQLTYDLLAAGPQHLSDRARDVLAGGPNRGAATHKRIQSILALPFDDVAPSGSSKPRGDMPPSLPDFDSLIFAASLVGTGTRQLSGPEQGLLTILRYEGSSSDEADLRTRRQKKATDVWVDWLTSHGADPELCQDLCHMADGLRLPLSTRRDPILPPDFGWPASSPWTDARRLTAAAGLLVRSSATR